MFQTAVVNYIVKDGNVELDFQDQNKLVVVPSIRARCLNTALLYHKGILAAVVRDMPHGGQRTEDTGYWSDSISQIQFSAYYSHAIQIGVELHREYNKGAIGDEEWFFNPLNFLAQSVLEQCKPLETLLLIGALNTFKENPLQNRANEYNKLNI